MPYYHRCATFKDHEQKDLGQALAVPCRTSVLALCQSIRTLYTANGCGARSRVSCRRIGCAASGHIDACTTAFARSLLASKPMVVRCKCDPRAFEPIAFLPLSWFVLIKRTWHNNRLPQCAPQHRPPHGRAAASSVRCAQCELSSTSLRVTGHRIGHTFRPIHPSPECDHSQGTHSL